MRMRKIALVAALSYVALASSVQANIQVSSSPTSKANQTSCDRFEGHWNGDGRISGEIIYSKFKCHYKGTVDVFRQGTNSEQYTIKTNLNLIYSDSDLICIPHGETTLPAHCVGGVINVKSDVVALNGNLNADETADLSGTIKINVGGSTITSNVDRIHLNR